MAWAILGPTHAWSQDAPQVTTVASYPGPAFLENLSAGPDGALLFTSYLDRSLLAWTGAGAPMMLAALDVHPVGILSRETDVVVSAHGTAFTEGPAFTATNEMLVLRRDGAVVRRVAAPDALFLNGLVELAPDVVLVADSLAGRIWRFDPAGGALDAWLDDPLLAVAPDAQGQRPAANGLKVQDGWLYVSNSSRGAIYRVRLDGMEPAGGLEIFAATGPVDDFAFLPDGSIAAATHGDKLIRVGLDGAVSDLLSEGCDGCTSVAPFGPDGRVVVLTTGGLLEGGTEPARVLDVAMPAG
jgi:sugar lactone lactonase YvrE